MMNRTEYLAALAFCRQAVACEISAEDVQGSWLNGIDVVLQSHFYTESVYEDICLFDRYLGAGSHILDFGAGAGYISLFLAGRQRKIQAIDYDDFADQPGQADTHREMANQQKAIWSAFHTRCPDVDYAHYDGQHIPFQDQTFDAVVAYAVLEHILDKDVPQVMSEIRRVLKPGGYLLISLLPREYSYLERLCGL
jgi:2-polyprenyl-3-methyl-5-hydroxy-6-metoxy-1,4-benzoquinol methylase